MAHASLIKAPSILSDALMHLLSEQENQRPSSIAAIKESVTALEAFINEIAELGHGYEVCGHSEENPLVSLSRKLKKAEGDRESIMEKVQIAYETLSGTKGAKGTAIYQKLSLVVNVRNELTHPKASVINISNEALTPPEKELKLLKQLAQHGFKCTDRAKHDWTSAVENKRFARWAHLSVVDVMFHILNSWPYKEAIDSFIKLYGLDNYTKK